MAVDAKKVDRTYFLPPELPEIPCIRIGTTHLPDQDPKALKLALVASYLGQR